MASETGLDGKGFGQSTNNVGQGNDTSNPDLNAPSMPTGPNAVGGGNAPANEGGNGKTPVTPPALSNNPNTGYIQNNNFPWALVGRFDTTNPNAVRFSLPGTKIGVRFTGTSLTALLASTGSDSFDVTIDGNEYVSQQGNFWTVSATPTTTPSVPASSVSGFNSTQWPGALLMTKSSNLTVATKYQVVTGLPAGTHTAWLTKRTEYYQTDAGTVTLFGFTTDSNAVLLTPPPYRARRVEIVGDSSVTGYGGAQIAPCTYLVRNANGGKTYAAQLGNYLHAETVNLSSSGKGVYMSYFDRNSAEVLPKFYLQKVPPETTAYNFAEDHVDVVVLNAGGDDLWGTNGSGNFNNGPIVTTTSARTNFVSAYTNWLTSIRSQRPDALIMAGLVFGASGGDLTTLGSAIQEAVTARNTAGDTNVQYFVYFPTNDKTINPNGYADEDTALYAKGWSKSQGCQGHPTPPIAQYLAGIIGPVIAQRMGWKDVGF